MFILKVPIVSFVSVFIPSEYSVSDEYGVSSYVYEKPFGKSKDVFPLINILCVKNQY